MIFEAVPNVSLGHDPSLLSLFSEAIASANTDGHPIKLLDRHSDIDHNRAVFSYIGSASGIMAASTALLAAAYDNISLEDHSGVHPFCGVVDVLPVIPVLQATMADAIELSQSIGEAASALFGVPVFYYEHSSSPPQKTSLPDLRKYLKDNPQEIGVDNKKGALIVGAREFLVAYNINLSCTDLELAKKVAANLREKNSGLAGVRALGLRLESKEQVQVSMNLTQPLKVPTKIVYNEVKSLLKTYQRQDIQIQEELVGLLPEDVIKEAKELEQKND